MLTATLDTPTDSPDVKLYAWRLAQHSTETGAPDVLFNAPAVCHARWSEADWINYVDWDLPENKLARANAMEVLNDRRRLVTTRTSTYEANGRTVYKSGGCPSRYRLGEILPTHYNEVYAWADGDFRAVWTSKPAMSVISYCEGDIIMTFHDKWEDYQLELAEAEKFYSR